MYFLINDIDGSVNYYSEEPIPEFMIQRGITAIERSVDHIPPEITDLTHLFYDAETDTVQKSKKIAHFQPISQQEYQEILQQQQLVQQAVQSTETEKWSKLVTALGKMFPDNPEIQEILSDGSVTLDEFAQIESMLNSSENT
jgi:hypothetical protein